MKVLCIDTSTELATVAFAREGALIASEQWTSAKGHAEALLSAVDRVLERGNVERSEIECVGVCIGPGGFTAVRVGLATAKGMALGLGAQIVGVRSLPLIARSSRAPLDAIRLCALNAYRGDVYAAAYRVGNGAPVEVCAPTHGPPADVVRAFSEALADEHVCIVGGAPGAAALVSAAAGASRWQTEGDIRRTSDALVDEVLARLGTHGPDSLTELEPLYLRASDAQLPTTPLRTR